MRFIAVKGLGRTAALAALLVLVPATSRVHYESRAMSMARHGFAVTVFDRYGISITPDEDRSWHFGVASLETPTAIESAMEHRAVRAVRSGRLSATATSEAKRAAREFHLKNPELLYAITTFERSHANIWTDVQNLFCSRGIPVGRTFGPLQMSLVTIRNIEKKVLCNPSVDPSAKALLLPVISDDREGRQRLLDEKWSYRYAAAWVYLWQQQHPEAALMDFVVTWNDKEKFKNQWFEVAPTLLATPET